jgi:hypothetical protein
VNSGNCQVLEIWMIPGGSSMVAHGQLEFVDQGLAAQWAGLIPRASITIPSALSTPGETMRMVFIVLHKSPVL